MAIVFIKKNRNKVTTSAARFTIIKCADSFQGRVVIPKEKARKISKTEYIAVGIDTDRNRIYFEAADSETGFKMDEQKAAFGIRFPIHAGKLFYEQFVGDHAVYRDEDVGMYYIEAK